MLIQPHARKVPPTLVRGRIQLRRELQLRRCVPDAFGNALGTAFVSSMNTPSPASQAAGGSSGGNSYINGLDLDGDYSGSSRFSAASRSYGVADSVIAASDGGGDGDGGGEDMYGGGSGNPMYSLGGGSGMGLRPGGGMGLAYGGLRASGLSSGEDDQVPNVGGDAGGDNSSTAPIDNRRIVNATVRRGQGPLAAYLDAGLSPDQAQAAYGADLASGRVQLVLDKKTGVYMPNVQPGQSLSADLDDTRFAQLGGKAISAESGFRDYVQAKRDYEQRQFNATTNYGNEGRNSPVNAGGGTGSSVTQVYGPSMDNSYYVAPGFITSSYNQAVSMMSNSDAPWYDRAIGTVAATAMAPMMLLEETGRSAMNVPFYARQAGQNAAQFTLADSTEGKVVAGLNFVSNASAGFLGATAFIPASVSMKAPILTIEERAVAQFAGAEQAAAARATYAGDVYSPHFVGPVQWEYFYRGDATPRTSFLSSMAQERGLPVSTEFLSSRSAPQFTDIYASHGNIGSQGLPTIGVSKDPMVADYFARGSNQNQNGFVTTFRLESREAQSVAFRNLENRYDVFNINPNIGRMEQEYLFHNQIDKKYIFQQQPVRPR